MSEYKVWPGSWNDWAQDHQNKQYYILDRKTSGIQKSQAGLDIVSGAGWHGEIGRDCSRGFFPADFKNCPYCGDPLKRHEASNEVWIPPFGANDGLRLAPTPICISSVPVNEETSKKWIPQDPHPFSLPRPFGNYQFIVGSLGTRVPVLLIFDRTNGQIDYYSPAQGKWFSLGGSTKYRIAESRLPYWAWSVAFIDGEPGFAIPTDDASVWLTLDWQNASYTAKEISGKSLGGAASLENSIYIPALVDGALAIHAFSVSDMEWKTIDGPSGTMPAVNNGKGYCSVPTIDKHKRMIYWIAEDGVLSFDGIRRECMWRFWGSDDFTCRAVPELGPPYKDPAGKFWQLCFSDENGEQGKKAFRYYMLDGDNGDWEELSGGVFSSGISCFSRYYELWGKPWEAVNNDKVENIRIPLLCLDEKTKETVTVSFNASSILSPLELFQNRSERYPVEFKIESPNALPIEFRLTNAFNIAAPWETRLFFYMTDLFLYSAEDAVCYKWRII